jgi:hypothetical protein
VGAVHPTQNPARASGTKNLADLVHQAKTVLADYNAAGRAAYVTGYVRQTLSFLGDADSLPTEIRESLAYLVALDEMTGSPNVDTYHREDPVDVDFVLPDGIVGYAHTGRCPR